MIEILLSHPGFCLYPFFVMLMLVYALRTRTPYPVNRKKHDSLFGEVGNNPYRTSPGYPMPNRFGARLLSGDSFSSALGGVHALARRIIAIIREDKIGFRFVAHVLLIPSSFREESILARLEQQAATAHCGGVGDETARLDPSCVPHSIPPLADARTAPRSSAP